MGITCRSSFRQSEAERRTPDLTFPFIPGGLRGAPGVQEPGPWPSFLLWPLVWRPQDPRCIHTGVCFRDLDLGCGSAATPQPPTQLLTQDHWGPHRSFLNHSSTVYTNEMTAHANSFGLEDSVAGAGGSQNLLGSLGRGEGRVGGGRRGINSKQKGPK